MATVFRTPRGHFVPSVTADQMRQVDQVASQVFGLGILQMMENAGRNLASHVQQLLTAPEAPVVVLAGAGGNGGGGLCCVRHLLIQGHNAQVILDRPADRLRGPSAYQYHTLHISGMEALSAKEARDAMASADVIVDALIGYGLQAAPHGRTAELIELCAECSGRILSLDVPSGLDATTGISRGAVVKPERTLTLALPKTGLLTADAGELYLGNIGIPREVYARLGLTVCNPFGDDNGSSDAYWVRLNRTAM